MIVWSYGGGVQSVAIGVLIREGALPVPDLAVIADTSRERRTTWQYLREHMQPYLKPLGLTIHIASHSLATRDLYATSGVTIMPVYTSQGRLGTYCSGEWKREVILRFLRQQGVKSCDMWIGYSVDEVHRVPEKDHRAWCRMAFPLIDRMINRVMCLAIIKAAGLPTPAHSHCWMCPHQSYELWRQTLADPVDGPLALALDEEIRHSNPEGNTFYLHQGRIPLTQVKGEDGIETPTRPCEGGHCWT